MIPSVDFLSGAPVLILASLAALLFLLAATFLHEKFKRKSADALPAGREALIAALKERRDKAVLARRTKCEFLANMSHELRTPMNAVIGYSEILIDDLSALGRQSSELTKMHELGTLLLSRINDVLDLAKLEMGRLNAFSETILVEDLASDLADLGDAAQRNGNVFTLRLSDASCAVEPDARKLCQVVRHVFSAINAMLREGTIVVAFSTTSNSLTCSVLADGGSLDNDAMSRLFYGTERSLALSDSDESSRLGLALARELITFLGGTLALADEAKATGFRIELPHCFNHATAAIEHPFVPA